MVGGIKQLAVGRIFKINSVFICSLALHTLAFLKHVQIVLYHCCCPHVQMRMCQMDMFSIRWNRVTGRKCAGPILAAIHSSESCNVLILFQFLSIRPSFLLHNAPVIMLYHTKMEGMWAPFFPQVLLLVFLIHIFIIRLLWKCEAPAHE
jgi:hypothetical protein